MLVSVGEFFPGESVFIVSVIDDTSGVFAFSMEEINIMLVGPVVEPFSNFWVMGLCLPAVTFVVDVSE